MTTFVEEDEEQSMEGEALASIFCDDFEEIARSPFHWRIKIVPHAPGDGEENHVAVILDSKIPASYPHDAPSLEVLWHTGLTGDQVQEVRALAIQVAEENLGMAMIHTIFEEVKAWLIDHNAPPLDNSMHAAMLRRAQAADQEKEKSKGAEEPIAAENQMAKESRAEVERNRQKVLEGTPVSPDSFAAWNATFMREVRTGAATVHVEPTKQKGPAYFRMRSDQAGWVDCGLDDDDVDDDISLDDLSDLEEDDAGDEAD